MKPRRSEHMELTISVPKEVESVLAQKAAAEGKDIKSFVEGMITTQALRPKLDEILAPVRVDFTASGMTEDELDEFIEKNARRCGKKKMARGQKVCLKTPSELSSIAASSYRPARVPQALIIDVFSQC